MTTRVVEHKVLVVPEASRNSVSVQHDGSLRVLVSAPTVGGQANQAVVRLLAKRFGVQPEAVSIVSGTRGRHKKVKVTIEEPDPDPNYKPCTTPYLCEDCGQLHWTNPSRASKCPWCKSENIKEITKDEAVKRGGKMAAMLNALGSGDKDAFIDLMRNKRKK